jgi:hypothetical protein
LSTEYATLVHDGRLRLQREGFEIDSQLDSKRARVYIVTAVFNGGNFVPESVRRCLQGHGLHALDKSSDVRLIIDEEYHRVLLLLQATVADDHSFEEILHDFLDLATEWRLILDEYGQQDLVYVKVPG